jgi:hypothetical protein
MNTKDMNYAAFLISNNQKLEDCYAEGRRFWFVFSDNEVAINPQDFVNAQKILKNLIRNFQPV